MKINILVIGMGMYVCGRGTEGFGTILPSIFEWKRKKRNILGKTHFVGTSSNSANILIKKIKILEKKSGINLDYETHPKNKKIDKKAFIKVLKQKNEINCAIIAVPDFLHYSIAKECLLAGLHILLVKPFTTNYLEGKKLISLAKSRGLYGVVDFHKRWDKANLLFKKIYFEKKLGEILYSIVEYSQKKFIPTDIFKNWSDQTNILQYLGVHYIDLIYFITSAKPVRVMTIGQKKFLIRNNLNTYDSIQCVIEWQIKPGNNFIQVIHCNWIDPNTSSSVSDQKIKFIGTFGRYESDQKDRGIKITTDDLGIEHINPDFCQSYLDNEHNEIWSGYGIDSICTFIDDVYGLKKNYFTINDLKKLRRPTFSESLISTAVLEAANKSLLKNSSWQKISNYS